MSSEKARSGLLAAALLVLAGCRSGEPPAPPPAERRAPALASGAGAPNVLFVSIDTTRADHCSVDGYAFPTTPRLAQLAKEGALVKDAYAPMATTGPSHATMMTSLYPLSHGVVKNGYQLTPEHVTLAERLLARGYATAAIVSSYALSSRFGLKQGFASYDEDFGPRRADSPIRWEGQDLAGAFDRRADQTSARAQAWLRARPKQQPFFLWVHFFDPHAPYDPPRAYRDLVRPPDSEWPRPGLAREIWKYDGEIRFADFAIGALLDALAAEGLRDSTLVVVVGDHGEGLGDHGRMEHGVMIYEEAVRVPLLFRFPARVPAGLEIAGPIPLIDLEPTILDFVLAPGRRDGMQGQSQLAVLEGRAPADPERKIFLQRRYFDPGSRKQLKIAGEKFAVRIGTWKYLVAEEEKTRELYDLAADPKELANLADKQEAKARALDQALDEWRRAQKAAAPQQMSPEDVERLKALGYVQ